MAEAPPGPGPIRITPSREQAGQRIDRLLAEAIGTISRSRVKALIDEGALSRTAENARANEGAGPMQTTGTVGGTTMVRRRSPRAVADR